MDHTHDCSQTDWHETGMKHIMTGEIQSVYNLHRVKKVIQSGQCKARYMSHFVRKLTVPVYAKCTCCSQPANTTRLGHGQCI